MTYPACGNDGVHLGRSVYAEHGDLSVPAEFWWSMGVSFDFFIDLGACVQEAFVGQYVLGAIGS